MPLSNADNFVAAINLAKFIARVTPPEEQEDSVGVLTAQRKRGGGGWTSGEVSAAGSWSARYL